MNTVCFFLLVSLLKQCTSIEEECVGGTFGYKCICAGGFWGPGCQLWRTTPAARTTEKVTGTTPIPITILPTTDGCGLAKVDLVIILDSSTSIGQDNFDKMLQFTKDLLKNSDIDSGSVRVGILSYSTKVTVHFQLKDYKTKSAVFDAIDDIPYTFGSTNTADSIKTMRKEMFTRANGDRSDVKNIAIVITDGVSNINSRRTVPEAEEARNIDGIHIYAIGIGLSDVRQLNQMASVPAKDNSFTVKSFDELVGLDQKIFSALCPGPTRRPTTTKAPTTTVICLGTSSALNVSGKSWDRYLDYKRTYTNCTHVDGNLEITFLDGDEEYDLSFLETIEEVSGYVLIYSVFVQDLHLKNLRLIRGNQLYSLTGDKLYSLVIGNNAKPNSKTRGLMQLGFKHLQEIMNGIVYFYNNNLLCYEQSILWADINPTVFPHSISSFNNTYYRRPCNQCDPSCYNEKTENKQCWGAGKDMCQNLNYRTVCSQNCDERCFGTEPNQCCHPECAAGCTGPRKTECFACKHYYNDGECVSRCPPHQIYNPYTLEMEENPYGKFVNGFFCQKDCPRHLLKDKEQNVCVKTCRHGMYDNNGTCVECNGPCSKSVVTEPITKDKNNTHETETTPAVVTEPITKDKNNTHETETTPDVSGREVIAYTAAVVCLLLVVGMCSIVNRKRIIFHLQKHKMGLQSAENNQLDSQDANVENTDEYSHIYDEISEIELSPDHTYLEVIDGPSASELVNNEYLTPIHDLSGDKSTSIQCFSRKTQIIPQIHLRNSASGSSCESVIRNEGYMNPYQPLLKIYGYATDRRYGSLTDLSELRNKFQTSRHQEDGQTETIEYKEHACTMSDDNELSDINQRKIQDTDTVYDGYTDCFSKPVKKRWIRHIKCSSI